MREDEVVGIFALNRPEPGLFAPAQVKLVQTFADQAVIAIENVRLFNEVQAQARDDLSEALQQQTATADVLKVISRSAFDLQAVLDTLVEFGGPALRARIWLRSAGEAATGFRQIGELRLCAAIQRIHVDKIRFPRAVARSPAARWLYGEVLQSPNILEDPGYTSSNEAAGSWRPARNARRAAIEGGRSDRRLRARREDARPSAKSKSHLSRPLPTRP